MGSKTRPRAAMFAGLPVDPETGKPVEKSGITVDGKPLEEAANWPRSIETYPLPIWGKPTRPIPMTLSLNTANWIMQGFEIDPESVKTIITKSGRLETTFSVRPKAKTKGKGRR